MLKGVSELFLKRLQLSVNGYVILTSEVIRGHRGSNSDIHKGQTEVNQLKIAKYTQGCNFWGTFHIQAQNVKDSVADPGGALGALKYPPPPPPAQY